jgi:hypothetical protein
LGRVTPNAANDKNANVVTFSADLAETTPGTRPSHTRTESTASEASKTTRKEILK